MKNRKLLYVLPILISVLFLSEYAFTKLANFTSTTRAWDVIGPGITSRKDCSGCHADLTAITHDSSSRVFTFGSGPRLYLPGQTYTIKFKIIGSGPVGFSSTVLKNDSNIMCGILAPIDTNETKVYLHTGSGRYYINHRIGTTTAGSKEYSYSWTAPPKGSGSVTFYYSSLSSNNDGTQDFDTVFQNSFVVNEGTPSTGVSGFSETLNLKVYPNPASDKIQVQFNQQMNGLVEIQLISLDGKQALTLWNYPVTAGEQHIQLNLAGMVKPGIYFIRIENAIQSGIQKILVY